MKIRAAVFCLAAAACAVAQQVPKKIYRVETSDPKDIRMEVVHGETINLQWTFLSYANPLDIESAAVTLHARTNGMAEGVSFQVPGAAGPGGVATVRLAVSEWLPASVSEAEWTLEVVQPDAARILRAKGTVTATRSAAASTNDPVPVVWLDDIRAEIGAVQALGPRLDSIETEAADWRAAFAWGPHFAAGYLLPADLAPYATTQQVAAAVAGMATTQQVAAASNALAQAADAHAAQRNPHRTTAADVGAITNEQDLAALRTYHYGSPDIVESPAEWFEFDVSMGAITGFYYEPGRENVVIPWAINGVAVRAIGADAFRGSSLLSSVTLPRSIVTLGVRSFMSTGLTEITVPDSVAQIGFEAFYDCFALTNVIFRGRPPQMDAAFGATPGTLVATVPDPQAAGWGAALPAPNDFVPVVRPPLYGDEIYRAGQPVATEAHVAQAIAGKVDQDSGMATNLWLQGETIVSDSYTNLWWRNVYSNGWHWLVAYTNAPGGAQ